MCELFAVGEQGVRAADCNPFVKEGRSPFLTVSNLFCASLGAEQVELKDGPNYSFFPELWGPLPGCLAVSDREKVKCMVSS